MEEEEFWGPDPVSRRDWGIALAWVVFGLLVYGLGIGARDLWDPDEPRYAEVAREMVEDGHWLVPHVNGRVYGHKPPLFFWTVAGLARLTGAVDSWTARAPSVAAAALLLGLTYLFGVRWLGRIAALFGTAVYAGNYLTVSLAGSAHIDSLHALFCVGALYAWFESVERERPWGVGILLAWALAGLAILTKGVGFLLILLAVVAYLVWSRRGRSVALIGWNLAGVALAIGIVAAWYFPAQAAGGEAYAAEIGIRQTITRATSAWSHERPFWYFLVNFPVDALPWTLFLPGVLAALPRMLQGARRNVHRYLTGWFAVMFLFFSAVSGKRHIYLLPLYPAFALVTGAWLERTATELGGGLGNRFFVLPASLLRVLLMALAMGGIFFAERLRAALPSLIPSVYAGAGLLLLYALSTHFGRWRKTVGGFVAALTALIACLTLLAQLDVLPKLDPLRSARTFAERVNALVPPGAPVASYAFFQEELVFYSHRYFVELEDDDKAKERAKLEEFLGRDGTAYVVMREKDFNRLGDLAARIEVIHRGRLGGDDALVVRERG